LSFFTKNVFLFSNHFEFSGTESISIIENEDKNFQEESDVKSSQKGFPLTGAAFPYVKQV
jgi:hypothetical protein